MAEGKQGLRERAQWHLKVARYHLQNAGAERIPARIAGLYGKASNALLELDGAMDQYMQEEYGGANEDSGS